MARGGSAALLATICVFSACGSCSEEEVQEIEKAQEEEKEEAEEVQILPGSREAAARHLIVAEKLEKELALGGANLYQGRSNLFQLQAQLHRGLGREEFWPELESFSLHRKEEEGKEEAVLSWELSFQEESLVQALRGALDWDESQPLPAPSTGEPLGAVSLSFGARELATLVEREVPDSWLHLLSIGVAEERRALIELLREVLFLQEGAIGLAFYSGPRRWAGEVFLSVRVADAEDFEKKVRDFHHNFLADFWMPLFDARRLLKDDMEIREIAGVERELNEIVFPIPHGGFSLGVCWFLRGDEYLGYYGLHPCRRLQEILEGESSAGESTGRGSLFRGSLIWLLTRVFGAPAEELERLFDDLLVEIQATPSGENGLQVNARFEDLPGFEAFWAATSELGDLILARESFQESGLDLAPTFMEPGLMVLGVPGVGGLYPPALLLGLPFNYGPMQPLEVQRLKEGRSDDHRHEH